MGAQLIDRTLLTPGSDTRVQLNFREACKAAVRVFQLSEKYKTAPYPNAYAVWFAYSTKSDPALVAEIDELLLGQDTISPYDIDVLFQAYLAEDQSAFAAHDLSQAIGDEIGEVLSVIDASLQQNSAFTETLTTLEQDLPKAAASPEQLNSLVSGLIDENRRMSAMTAELNQGLVRSQNLIAILSDQLDEVRTQSLRDPLTSIPNRRAFDKTLEDAIHHAARMREPLCVAMADLDHFKALNDTYGHEAGDVVLQNFARLISSNADEPRLVARHGGEEFAILFPGSELMEAYNRLVNIKHLLTQIDHQLVGAPSSLPVVTASFGVAQYKPGMTARELMQKADKYLYEAKTKGRNRVCAPGLG